MRIGLFRAHCTIPPNFLNEGRYTITAIVSIDGNNSQVLLEEAVSFTVHDTGEMRKEYQGGWIGVVRPKPGVADGTTGRFCGCGERIAML